MPAINDRGKIGLLAAVSALMLAAVLVVWAFVPRSIAPRVNVRWVPELSDTTRTTLERRFSLVAGEHSGGTTWAYDLSDFSHMNIEALVAHQAVDDTHHIDRATATLSRDAPSGTTRVAGAKLASLRSPIVLEWTALIACSSLLVSTIWLATAGLAPRRERRGSDLEETRY